MDVVRADTLVSKISTAIAEPARTRMLYCLMDGHARTATELGIVAEVSPSTASTHLARLQAQRLVKVVCQGKYRYYSLDGENVAAALEALAVVAGAPHRDFVPRTPVSLRAARTCYDHMAGSLAVRLLERLLDLGWLFTCPGPQARYDVTPSGLNACMELGLDVGVLRGQRRHFACACLDWSERRPHLAGALGAALLKTALRKKWVIKELDSRVLRVTPTGRRALQARFGVRIPD